MSCVMCTNSKWFLLALDFNLYYVGNFWNSQSYFTQTLVKTKKLPNFPKFFGQLTHFMPLVSFYTPWKYQKTRCFLIFSGGVERPLSVNLWSQSVFQRFLANQIWEKNVFCFCVVYVYRCFCKCFSKH